MYGIYGFYINTHTHADTYRNEFHICSLSRGPIASPKPWARMRPGQKARQPGPTSHADMVEQIPKRIQWKPKKQHPQNWWNPTKSQYLFKMWPVKIIQNAWTCKNRCFSTETCFWAVEIWLKLYRLLMGWKANRAVLKTPVGWWLDVGAYTNSPIYGWFPIAKFFLDVTLLLFNRLLWDFSVFNK